MNVFIERKSVSTNPALARAIAQALERDNLHFPQVQLPAAHVQLPPQSQLEFPQPDIFKDEIVGLVGSGFGRVEVELFEKAGRWRGNEGPFYPSRPPPGDKPTL
jgi:hypothetical protein